MARLYLIRRNLESFAGPMSLAELKEAYKRMDFGLQDEVSGHCGPWVQLDHSELIRRHYPEIGRIVSDDLKGWGVSNHEPERISRPRMGMEGTRRILWAPHARNGALALTFLFIAALAFAAAVYMANTSRMSGKVKVVSAEPTPEEAQGFLDRREYQLFDKYIEDNLAGISAQLLRQKKLEQAWLPYLRYYAFNHEGQVSNLAPKLLRGFGAASAPVDCSLRAWRQRWRASLRSWNTFVTEKKLIRAHWARLLAWDPHWIKRRQHQGWLAEQNYYLACLTMAERAVSELLSDASLVQVASDWEKLGINKIKQRLLWQLDVARTGSSNLVAQPTPDHPLAVWSCMEGAQGLKDLLKCRSAVQPPVAESQQDPWVAYTDERFGWNLLRLAAQQKGSLPPELVPPLAAFAAKATKADYFTRFDYRAELRLLRILTKEQKPGEKESGRPIEKIVERVYADFPELEAQP